MVKRQHPWLRRVLGFGVVASAAYAVWRAIEANQTSNDRTWEPQPFPFPPQPSTRAAEPVERAVWLEPVDGACPLSHPVKAKLAGGIYHVPGGSSYDRTHPDRCYRDAAAAQADGLRAAKH